jgi:hypothetical protein
MLQRTISLPELGLIAGTRGALGAGIGLLLANRLSDQQRRAVGWTLALVGLISTIPLAAHVLSSPAAPPPPPSEGSSQPQDQQQRRPTPSMAGV